MINYMVGFAGRIGIRRSVGQRFRFVLRPASQLPNAVFGVRVLLECPDQGRRGGRSLVDIPERGRWRVRALLL